VDIVGEQHSDRRLVTAGVEGLLRLVQPAQQVDGLGSLRDMAMVAVLAEELRGISGDRPGVGCPPGGDTTLPTSVRGVTGGRDLS
jgi:hypothetical protein